VDFVRSMRDLLFRAARLGLDAVVPPTCLRCDTIVSGPAGLCARCWPTLAWIDRPFCARCGLPFEFDARDALCGACLARPGRIAIARAALRYDAASRDLVLGFKQADRTFAAPTFARWMARAGAEALEGADMLAPVPLHWTRLVRRRFNQSALLARALARESGVPCLPDLLVRVRRTPVQGELGRAARRRNVARAFKLRGRHLVRVRGRTVVLVDDVHTTGATLEECARVLRRAGAAEVRAVALARVVRPGEAG
jgi:ComF family protein